MLLFSAPFLQSIPSSIVHALPSPKGEALSFITVLLFVSIQLYSLLLRLLLRLSVPQSCRHMDPTQYSPCIVQDLCTLRLHCLKSLRRLWNSWRSITCRSLYLGTSTSTWKHLPFHLL